MNICTDVLIVGGGPAGIATAIAARAKGFQTLVIDGQTPPIDKPCGEGLLPHGVAALRELGIQLNSCIALPFRGIQFADRDSSASAQFSGGQAFALRRLRLHQLLLDAASQAGVSFLWGTYLAKIERGYAVAAGNRIQYEWLVGADGQNSGVRNWANLEFRSVTRKRFAFRKHFQISPWSDLIEAHWGNGCQIVVTPTAKQEIGVAVFSRDPRFRLDHALPMFPRLAAKLQGAMATSKESGNTTSLTRLPAVTRGNVALVGDASGTVDAITGHGLSMSFQEALHLADALKQGNLARYESAHRKTAALPAAMTRLMLLMEQSGWVRRRILRVFQNKPALFSKLLSIHIGELPFSSIGAQEMAHLGWKFLCT